MHEPPKRLILLACTATKRANPDPLPALWRYDGPSFRTLRKWQTINPAAAENLDILILSANLGLIAADALISDYNQRMTPARATELRQAVSAALTHFVAQHGPYMATLVHLGQDYQQAIAPALLLAPALGVVTHTVGGIGTRLSQIKAWLTTTVEEHPTDTAICRDWVVNVYADEQDDDHVTDSWIVSDCTEHEAQQAVKAESDAAYILTPAAPWHIQWADEGDDIACPNCARRQLQTENGTTCCRVCGWQADNPVAI